MTEKQGPVAYVTEEMIAYAKRWGGMCRDCADENGICPSTGIACGGRDAAVRFTAKALNYGIEHGFIKPPASAITDLQEEVERLTALLTEERERGDRMASDWFEFCEDMEAKPDTQEAVAYELKADLSNLRHRAEAAEARATAAEAENERLRNERYELAYAITGGEDAPGLLDSVTVSQLVEVARDSARRHSAEIDRATNAESELSQIAGHLECESDSDSILHSIREAEADRDIYRDRATAAEQRLEKAMKVIEPFATCEIDEACPDTRPLTVDQNGPNYGHVRAARAFIEGAGNE